VLSHPLLPRSGTSAASIKIADCSRADYQLQLSQTPVKDIAWLHAGQTSPILPSFMLEGASSRDSARVTLHVLHARRVCICSSVASSGVPKMVPVSPLEVAAARVVPQSGVRSVRLPSRCTRYTTYLISGCSTVPSHGGHFTIPIVSGRNFGSDQTAQAWSGRHYSHATDRACAIGRWLRAGGRRHQQRRHIPVLVYQDGVARLCSGTGLAGSVRRHGDPVSWGGPGAREASRLDLVAVRTRGGDVL